MDNTQIVGKESEIEENNKVEKEYNWNPQKEYFTDNNHRCQLPFNNTWHCQGKPLTALTNSSEHRDRF